MEYRYRLAPYAGKNSRRPCPKCHRRDFVPYIDTETGEMLSETCGRCNHESSCGYHLTPAQYFQEHPEARPQGDSWRQPLQRPSFKRKTYTPMTKMPKDTVPVNELPREIVQKTIRMDRPNNFVKFLDTLLDPLIVEDLVFTYNLGTTKAGETIFYQQDGKGRFRGGKVIQYNPDTGHRIKDAAFPVYWIHQNYIRRSYIPQDWKMTQCLFGEHLLQRDPEKLVCLVEAEKSAVICAGFMPEFIWVAVGGKTQLNERLDVLHGREVLAFPDIDAIEDWETYFASRADLNVTVSRLVEENCTQEDRAAQIDIADILIRWHREQSAAVPPVPSVPFPSGTERLPEESQPSFQNPVMREIAKYFSRESLANVEALVEEFDLVPISVQQIEPTENENTD